MADPLRPFPFFNPSLGRFPQTHFNFAFHNLFSYQFFFFQLQPQVMTHHFHPHTMFSFAIPILLNFLVLKYQNLDKSPFDTRPKTVLFGILSLLLYCFSYDYHQRLHTPRRASSSVPPRVFRHFFLFFGYMALACLASLLFPDSATPASYVLYVTVSVGDLLYLLCQRIRSRFGGRRFQGWPNSPFLASPWRIMAQRNSSQGHLLPL